MSGTYGNKLDYPGFNEVIEVNKEVSSHTDNNSVCDDNITPKKDTHDIHSLGVGYICSFLDRVGFTILEYNSKPDHHYQILAHINGRTLLIAVRSDYYPKVGTIDSASLEELVSESDELNALPHFAGLSVQPLDTNDIEVEGVVTKGLEYEVSFNGITAVKKSDLLAANG